jgi:hypothetical protein
MRDESGMELDWFWRDWIFTTSRLDQAVDSVSTSGSGASVIHLANRGKMVMPAEVAITFADGTQSTVRLPVEMWNLGSHFDYQVSEKKPVRRVELDPRHALPDIDRGNNSWPR